METFWRTATIAGIVLAGIVVYEGLRAVLVRRLKGRFRRQVRQFVREHGIHIDTFKFGNKLLVKAELENDIRINEQVIAMAQQSEQSIDELRLEVEEYIDEIVPGFNLLSYYKVGYSVARAVIKILYTPVIDHVSYQKLEPPTAADVVIFVANHRSNADYILVSYMLAHNIALSYAVGEWARVWPLEALFKSFGSYFVRRGEKSPLYHLVLERYVQLISRRSVSQGIFPEGGLSRDGALRPPKVGLLDYIARIKLAPDFTGDVLLIPVGINYDHVLEDEVLLREHQGAARSPGLGRKLLSLLRFCVLFPPTLLLNAIRTLLGRLRRHGYASVSFGAPISLSEFLDRQGGDDVLRLPRHQRRAKLQIFATEVLEAIGKVIPVTPVPLVARSLLALPSPVALTDLIDAVHEDRRRLRRLGARIVMGVDFEAAIAARRKLEDDALDGHHGIAELDREIIDVDEAEATTRLALELLSRRRLVRQRGDQVTLNETKRAVLEYYARSLDGIDPRPSP